MSLFAALAKLPRELRDQIYSYLTFDVALVWREPSLRGPLANSRHVTLHDAPVPRRALLLDSVMHEFEEYAHQPCRAATIRTSTHDIDAANRIGSISLAKLRHYFRDVERITVFVDCRFVLDTGQEFSFRQSRWDFLHDILALLSPRKLKSLRVARIFSEKRDLSRRPTHFTAIPKCFLDLQEVQKETEIFWTGYSRSQQIKTIVRWFAFGDMDGQWTREELEREWMNEKGRWIVGWRNAKEMEREKRKEKRVIKMKEIKEEGIPITKPKRKRKRKLDW